VLTLRKCHLNNFCLFLCHSNYNQDTIYIQPYSIHIHSYAVHCYCYYHVAHKTSTFFCNSSRVVWRMDGWEEFVVRLVMNFCGWCMHSEFDGKSAWGLNSFWGVFGNQFVVSIDCCWHFRSYDCKFLKEEGLRLRCSHSHSHWNLTH
jgi:hypothetical protein